MSDDIFGRLKDEMHDTRNEVRTAIALMGEEFARLHSEIADVEKATNQNGLDILATRKDLVTFTIRFEAFVSKIERENNLTHAQGEIVILNQEIEKKFGIYDKVRKVLLGILQSVDTGLVSKNSITGATEKLMLGTPRYWLTPSLISLAAWLNNDKTLAYKGLNEGLKRNLIKTELMFTLINNRLKRNKASFLWLSKYFEHQNPLEMHQETLILLGAYTDGIFGPDSYGVCKKQIEKWVNCLAKDEERVKALEEIWFNKISLLEPINENQIPFNYLKSNCPEWEKISNLLMSAQKQKSFFNYIKEIIEAKEIKKNYKEDLDNLLYKLVNEYDSDEFELKKKKSLAELIIKYEGDKEKAQQDFDTNVIILFKDKVSFFEILVNSINQTDMSPPLRRLSLLLMKEWIINAHNDYTAKYRLSYPESITLEFGGWSGKTKDGSNVKELLESYNAYLKDWYEKIINSLKGSIKVRLIFSILCCIWMFISSYNGISVFATAIFGFSFLKAIYNYFTNRAKLRVEMEQNKEKAKKLFNGFCAEFVDWQKAYATADKVSIEVNNTLNSYNSAEFTSNSAGNKIIM